MPRRVLIAEDESAIRNLMAEYLRDGTISDQRVAIVLYGLTNCAMAVAFNILWHHLMRHPELHKPGLDPELLAVRNRRYNIGLAVYPVTTVIGLFSTWAFLAIVFALALLYLLPTPDVRDETPGTQP